MKAIEENQFIYELVFFFSFKYKFDIYIRSLKCCQLLYQTVRWICLFLRMVPPKKRPLIASPIILALLKRIK